MTKAQLAQELAVSQHLPISIAHQAIDGIIDIIKNEIKASGEVTIRGLGTFKPYQCPERNRRNPNTGEFVKVPAHMAVKFKVSQKLIELLNQNNEVV